MPKPATDKECPWCGKHLTAKPLGGEDNDAAQWGRLWWDVYSGKGNLHLVERWKIHRYCFGKFRPFLVRKIGPPLEVKQV